MEAVEEGNKLLTSGNVHCQFQSGFDSFGATVCKVGSSRRLHRHNLVKLFRECGHVAIVIIGATHVYELRSLFLNGSYYFGVTVAGGAHRHSGVAIKEGVAVNILYPNTLSALSHKLERRPRIGGCNKLGVGCNYFATFWTR
jgi:hypothetical protein